MNQIIIGQFIARKRKECNLTQEQLAAKIGVTNKTISKWENGKCMPDYSVIEGLCEALGITLAELMNGECDERSIHTYDDEQVMTLVKEVQALQQSRKLISGILLFVMGIALLALHPWIGGSVVEDFFSGVLLGVSMPVMLVGAFITARAWFTSGGLK